MAGSLLRYFTFHALYVLARRSSEISAHSRMALRSVILQRETIRLRTLQARLRRIVPPRDHLGRRGAISGPSSTGPMLRPDFPIMPSYSEVMSVYSPSKSMTRQKSELQTLPPYIRRLIFSFVFEKKRVLVTGIRQEDYGHDVSYKLGHKPLPLHLEGGRSIGRNFKVSKLSKLSTNFLFVSREFHNDARYFLYRNTQFVFDNLLVARQFSSQTNGSCLSYIGSLELEFGPLTYGMGGNNYLFWRQLSSEIGERIPNFSELFLQIRLEDKRDYYKFYWMWSVGPLELAGRKLEVANVYVTAPNGDSKIQKHLAELIRRGLVKDSPSQKRFATEIEEPPGKEDGAMVLNKQKRHCGE